MYYCALCSKPIPMPYQQSNSTVPVQWGDVYCQCHLTITIRLNDYTVEVLKSLSRQLTPTKTPVPSGIYNAFTDEELSL
jgi:hypothetical protein